MASCTPVIVVLRSATIWEIDTFMTLLSSTITNWAAANTTIGSPRPPVRSPSAGESPADATPAVGVVITPSPASLSTSDPPPGSGQRLLLDPVVLVLIDRALVEELLRLGD